MIVNSRGGDNTKRRIVITLLLILGIVIAGFVITNIKNGIASKAEAQRTGGNTLYVGGSGANNYTSIQDAINAANDGDTIFVYSGIYDGPVVINKEIRLIGDPSIDGHGGYGIKIEANNVSVENFTIYNSSYGIYVHNNSFTLHNVTIHNCTIHDATYGIYAYGNYNVVIVDCKINVSFGGRGIEITGNYNEIVGNEISSNGAYIGIDIYSHNNTIENNVINGSFIYGIEVYGSSTYDNVITSNNICVTGNGIIISYAYSNTFLNNTINVSKDGIKFQRESSNNLIEKNEIKSNLYGIYIGVHEGKYDNNSFLDNIIHANSGIYLQYATNSTFINNSIESTNYAIYIENSTNNSFMNNTVGTTKLSFDYNGDLWIKNASMPASLPPHWNSIGKFLEIENMSDAWIFIKIYYDDSDVFGAIEDTLKIWKWNGSWYEDGWNGSRYLNTTNNVVGVNITSFSIFAPLGHKVKYVERDPIRINGNNEFTSENGVIGGSGTPDDPYIIEGWKINGTGYGNCIYIGNTTAYFIIRNCYLHNASGNSGIYHKNSNVYLYNVDNGRIDNCTIENAEYCGIYARYGNPQNNIIANNTIRYNNGWSIYIEGGLNNIIGNNTIYGVPAYYDAIYVHISESQKILNNTIYNSGIRISGWLEDFTTHVISGNTVNGKPVYYFKNENGFTVPSDAGQLILANCSDTTISGLHISNTSIPILLGFCSNITIENCMFNNNTFTALYLYKSDDCVITNNIFTGYNRIGYGVYVGGNENIMKDNYFTDLHKGILVQYGHVNNEIKFNTMVSCEYGIYLWATDYNAIVYNTIQNCVTWGIYVGSWCENNVIYHNNFIDNGGTKQAHDSTGNNTWDNGYPSGGNYWSDFDEPSEGAYDNNSDGIVDLPYSISGGNSKDRYPLTHPFVVFVDDDFNESTPGWQIDHFNKIQEAINAVEEGGIVYVYEGVYEGSIGINKQVSIISHGNPANTIIKASGQNAVTMHNPCKLDGFTIRDAYADNDNVRGIWVKADGCIIRNVTITNITAIQNNNGITIDAYGITIFASNITLENVTIYDIEGNDSLAYGIYAYESNNDSFKDITIFNITSVSTAYGMYISYSKDGELLGIDISNVNGSNAYGIQAHPADNYILRCINVTASRYGISLEPGSDYNIIENCIASNNSYYGIAISGATYNVIRNNSVYDNKYGITLWMNCYNNTIENNTIFNNSGYGVYFFSGNMFNTIKENVICDNQYGIYFSNAKNNTIYNNYFNNTINAYDNGNNTWNISKTAGENIIGGTWLGGNYWHDYTGIDIDKDGIGDTMLPYNCYGNIMHGGDMLPLVYATNDTIPPDITNITFPSKFRAGFVNITCIASDNAGIAGVWINITMPNGSYINESMQYCHGIYYFNTSFDIEGNYSFYIYAIDANGNGNKSNVMNFTVCPIWDINMDGRINVLDLIIVAMHFGSHEGEAGYDESVDLNNDGDINILDLIIVALQWTG